MARSIDELQAEAAANIAAHQEAKEAKEAHRQAVAEARTAIERDESLTQEVREFKSGCLVGWLDSGGALNKFESKVWPQLQRDWILQRAATEAAIQAGLKNF